jgi:hypothetical protein
MRTCRDRRFRKVQPVTRKLGVRSQCQSYSSKPDFPRRAVCTAPIKSRAGDQAFKVCPRERLATTVKPQPDDLIAANFNIDAPAVLGDVGNKFLTTDEPGACRLGPRSVQI